MTRGYSEFCNDIIFAWSTHPLDGKIVKQAREVHILEFGKERPHYLALWWFLQSQVPNTESKWRTLYHE